MVLEELFVDDLFVLPREVEIDVDEVEIELALIVGVFEGLGVKDRGEIDD